MEIRCVKGTYRPKLVSSENNSVFKGLINTSSQSSSYMHIHSPFTGGFESVLVY